MKAYVSVVYSEFREYVSNDVAEDVTRRLTTIKSALEKITTGTKSILEHQASKLLGDDFRREWLEPVSDSDMLKHISSTGVHRDYTSVCFTVDTRNVSLESLKGYLLYLRKLTLPIDSEYVMAATVSTDVGNGVLELGPIYGEFITINTLYKDFVDNNQLRVASCTEEFTAHPKDEPASE